MTWLFDVDGTLIGSIRSDRLRPGARELLDALAARRVRCVLWSAGGGVYAQRKAVEHRIACCFEEFYAKAERDAHGRYRLDHLALEHRPTVFVDDAPGDLPVGADVVSVPQFFGGSRGDRVLFDVIERLDVLVGP